MLHLPHLRHHVAIAACAVTTLTAALVVTMSLQRVGPVRQVLGALPIAEFPVGSLIALVSVLACWLLASVRPMSAVGLCLVSLSWLVLGLSGWVVLPASARAAAASTGDLAVAGIAVVVLCWHPVTKIERRLLVVCLCAVGSATLLRVAFYNPFLDPACWRTCLSTGAGWTWLDLSTLTVVTGSLTLIGGGAAAIGCARCQAPSLLRYAGLAALLALATGVVVSIAGSGASWPAVPIDALATASLVLVTVGAAITCGQVLRLRRSLRSVVSDLDATTDDGAAAMTPVRRLALANHRLQALASTQLDELQRSRERIESAADEERHRIEHDLHDGAQQHLVAAAIHLAAAQLAAGPTVDSVTRAALDHSAEAVRRGLRELRRLSHDDDAEPSDREQP